MAVSLPFTPSAPSGTAHPLPPSPLLPPPRRPHTPPHPSTLAARHAALDDVITALPAGYDTQVGEGGAILSGGQRQRLALARALLRESPVMILDEFTAGLDPVTEQRLLATMAPILRDRTVLLITHRPTVLALADRVVTLAASAPEPR